MARWRITITGELDIEQGQLANFLAEKCAKDVLASVAVGESGVRASFLRNAEQEMVAQRCVAAREILEPGPGRKELTIKYDREVDTE